MLKHDDLANTEFAVGMFDGLIRGTNWPKDARDGLKALLAIWLRPKMVQRLKQEKIL